MAMVRRYFHGWSAVIVIAILLVAGAVLNGAVRKFAWIGAVIVAIVALYVELMKK